LQIAGFTLEDHKDERNIQMAESPKYTVIKKQDGIEIRQYAGYIQAEVAVADKGYRSAINKGFNVLAGYIFGKNISRQKIEMTTPVQATRSEKIAMTTPVTVTGEDSFTVAFIMPSEYTLETLPQPTDDRIQIKPIPAHQMAAIRFSGYFNHGRIQKSKERLSHWLAEQGLETEGDFIVAGYNPPWVPGFLARNEVLIRINAN
jgi:effector-binding domain-containing protein